MENVATFKKIQKMNILRYNQNLTCSEQTANPRTENTVLLIKLLMSPNKAKAYSLPTLNLTVTNFKKFQLNELTSNIIKAKINAGNQA